MDTKNFQKINTQISNNGVFLTNPMQISYTNTIEDKKEITNFEVKRENNLISNGIKEESDQKNSNSQLENDQPVTLIAPWKSKEPFQNILVKTFDVNGEITNVKSESIHVKNDFEIKRNIFSETEVHIKPASNEINNNVNPSSEGEKNFQCLTCFVMFSRSTDLTRHHSVVHEGKKPFQCEICEYQTIRSYDLKRHVLKVHNRFPCEICSSIFYRDYELKAHLSNVHSISTFNSQSFLNILNTQDVSIFDGKAFYEGKKTIMCTICNSQFSSHSNLRSHITQVHERKRPHKCGTCDYQFSRRFDMKRHIERVHQGKKKVDNLYSQGYV